MQPMNHQRQQKGLEGDDASRPQDQQRQGVNTSQEQHAHRHIGAAQRSPGWQIQLEKRGVAFIPGVHKDHEETASPSEQPPIC